VTEARTTSVIRKAPGRRASDANRSRLGDLTRPVAKEQRITPNRRPAVLLGVAGLVVASSIGAALFGLPVRTWFGQNDEIDRLERQLDELQSINSDLQREVDGLGSENGIMAAAREQLGLTFAGERRQTVVDMPALPTDLPDGWPYSPVEQMIVLRADPAATAATTTTVAPTSTTTAPPAG
jgi:cell division protein FtsL